MRRLLLVVFACLGFVLIDAAPILIVPVVIVYPLIANSASLDREATARIATTLATQIAQGGAIKVIAAKPGVERQNYLADARANGANYYVTGFITPLGNGASVVEQVVSTTSGTLVFSVTNFISTLAEVVDQGDQLREGIVARTAHALQQFSTPTQAATPEPEPTNGDAIARDIFGRKKKSGTANVVAAAPAVNATLAILLVGGGADADARTAAATALVASFGRAGRHAVITSASTPSAEVCTNTNAGEQIAAWLDQRPAGASLRMIAYDCSGKAAFDRTFQNKAAGANAISGAADAAVTAYLTPPKGR